MKSRPQRPKDTEKDLYAALLALETPEECAAFFHDLCTPAELEALADRWRAAKMLDAGMSYRAIASKTGISVTTVTRVARFLHIGHSGYKTILERLKKA
jgi:TrpR-related protein YerC/YecD